MADQSSELTSQELPSTTKQAINLLQQGVDSAAGLLKGGKFLADLDKQNHRWAICAPCEFLVKKHRCSRCGCVMPFKVRFEAAKCPVSKW